MPTYREVLQSATERLRASGIESARLDAEVLLCHTLGIDRTELYRRLPESLAVPLDEYWQLVERRARGEPVAYLTGHREFYGLDFIVTPDTLIPRPETEYLVSWAVERLRHRRDRARCVDVGTGCGAIVIAIAATLGPEHPSVLVGCDRSLPALRVARRNRDRLAPGRVHLVCGHLLTWCRGPLHLVVANLPYLRPEQWHPGIAFEPPEALFAADSGFGLYTELLPQVADRLASDGGFIFEIDPAQAERAMSEARQHFPEATLTVLPDLAGLPRYVTVERKTKSRAS
ncbi:peptide chain release factor N(5)-glutamine methyltransferase [Thermomicrobium sp. 4228-Ro]|uniref:peptide chain release factor N(5)-glutamine methyltransferase n=1 Tax=Thermomicrobium sp. 4228-Ro TaxID=2993937 RepID=UPI002248F4EB|nr:peptide chain release factor N(5)-glutamine methyltransferase [Thermomicrobium sp. 4228-Ro]MCX2727308.1 peptide chain release factor N(5)-glutamine methyltransferase [Thermomicrobium sp. 4228-Ro]